jgi:predicted HNH restriction endonuclease
MSQIDPSKLILLNIGWMREYKGPDNDPIFNGGRYPKTFGHRKGIGYYRTIGYLLEAGSAERKFIRRLEQELMNFVYIARTSEESALAYEGDMRVRQHISYERSRALSEEKKRRFRALYGRVFCEVKGCPAPDSRLWGDEYIECHHTLPLAKLKSGRITPADELLLVCASCHRRLHSGPINTWISVQQLEKRLGRHAARAVAAEAGSG